MPRGRKIPIIVCIDVEPDARVVDRSERAPWLGLERVAELFSVVRSRVVAATGSPARFSWFVRMDPQVTETYGSEEWAVTRYARLVEEWRRHGDSIGLHTHPWRWSDAHRTWVHDVGDQAWVEHCVRVAFEAYERSMGEPCRAFRFGDRWFNDATVDLVERLGARFDLTLEPGRPALAKLAADELATGSIPDTFSVPCIPFRRSRADFRRPDPARRAGLWMIPMSSAPVETTATNGAPVEHTTLGMWIEPSTFARAAARLLESLPDPYLALVLRSDLPIRAEVSRFFDNLDWLLRHQLADRFVFSTPEEALETMGLDARRTPRRPQDATLLAEPSSPWRAELAVEMPEVLPAGQTVGACVIATNVGRLTWYPHLGKWPRLALGYHVHDRSGRTRIWDGARTPLGRPVPPGERIALSGRFQAPEEPGEYQVEWDVVSEGECWFGLRGSKTAATPIRVVAPTDRAPADIKVAVAVRTWNVLQTGRRDAFERTLSSLRHAGHPFELVLVDNGSTDGTARLVRDLGGYAAPRIGDNNDAGWGMNVAIHRALRHEPDIVVFSDDDIAWKPRFLAKLVRFWTHAPEDVALLGGYVEPQWEWNTVRGVIDCGGTRALVRDTAPGGSWSFLARNWTRIGPVAADNHADMSACVRLRAAGLRVCQTDLAEHIGWGRSTWGNQPAGGVPIDRKGFGL